MELVPGVGTTRGHEPEPAKGTLMANGDPDRLQSTLERREVATRSNENEL